MAAAVCRLFERVKLDIGPATEEGFYYDFDLPHRITPEDFPAIEKEMAKIIEADIPFEYVEVTRKEALEVFKDTDQTYKIERLADIPEGETISFYRCGEFQDLCRGPHLKSTGEIKAFKLLSTAGSYFRGMETNPMLQRIYGIAAESSAEIEEFLAKLEEAQKRDHRVIGRALDLFAAHDEVGAGLIHWHPKGARIRCLIEDFWREEHFKAGYEMLFTPHIGRAELWETSGHLDFYKEGMFSSMEIDENEYYAKPMNCPFHIQVYKSRRRSYRELPLRWAELGTVYRYEKAGVLRGLFRVRGFTQDDAHIFCMREQMASEIKDVINFADKIFKSFGFEQITAYLSTKPPKAIGAQNLWDEATESLKTALELANMPYTIDEGAGAFYGPKVDLKIKDVLGREWQLTTVQFDFNEPERFDMTYTGADGHEHRPYMIHRALLGSLERFFGILIEHYGGAFPAWLAPEQVRILPITDKQLDKASEIAETLRNNGFRSSVDSESGKIGAKIRNAQVDKVPYMLIIGPRDVEQGMVSVRCRLDGDKGSSSLEDFMALLREAVDNKK
ncbi:MAG: threonine--tRNA ligase [Lentisphaerae bacterium]|nr:threonine--tRNA ligase [Lentisphaerota bacterium]